jgi:hypothetical protein
MQIAPYAESIIVTISHLFRKGTPEVQGKVFYVTVRSVFADYTKDEESIAGFTQLAVVAEQNYVQVYASLTPRPNRGRDITDWRSWKLICDHDSAWRDDGVASALKSAYKLTQALAVSMLGTNAEKLSVHIAIDDMEIADLPEHRFEQVARGALMADQLLPQ